MNFEITIVTIEITKENIKIDVKNENNIEEEVNFSDTDEYGNKILVNDIKQGIKIVEVKSNTYAGQLVFIDDPSRVYVGHTEKKGVIGKLILDYLKDEECIAGINANGFSDPNGKGKGGDIIQ